MGEASEILCFVVSPKHGRQGLLNRVLGYEEDFNDLRLTVARTRDAERSHPQDCRKINSVGKMTDRRSPSLEPPIRSNRRVAASAPNASAG